MDDKILDTKIDVWRCSQFTDYKMKRVPGHKFIPEPDAIECDGDTIRDFAKYFYNLGKNRGQRIQVLF